MANTKPTLGITVGDPNGVGYEVILKALSQSEIYSFCTPVVYGNRKHLQTVAATLGEEYRTIQAKVIDCYSNDVLLEPGKPTAAAGAAALACLERATKDLRERRVDALVTAPINKDTIQSDAFRFNGHTEYLTDKFGREGRDSLMMMVSERMRVALVTNHTPVTELAGAITTERIVEKLSVLNDALREDFRIRRPRIAVLALNPHAGDNGLIGKEEQTVIAPALEKAAELKIDAFGPYSADGFFGAGQYCHFDAVLAMYHDQGLAPFKALDMSGVNYTAGLTIVRTSPDHGTAYAIAGKNQADSESMLHAIYLAVDSLRIRAEWRELNSNPLKIEERERPERRPERFLLPFPKSGEQPED